MAKEAIEKKECVSAEVLSTRWKSGGYGIENELEEDEIAAEADAVLLAIAIGTGGMSVLTKRDEGRVPHLILRCHCRRKGNRSG